MRTGRPVAAASPTMLTESAVTIMVSASASRGIYGFSPLAVPQIAAMACDHASNRLPQGRRRAAGQRPHEEVTPALARLSRCPRRHDMSAGVKRWLTLSPPIRRRARGRANARKRSRGRGARGRKLCGSHPMRGQRVS